MTHRDIFIETTKSLFVGKVRRITTDPFCTTEGFEFAIPVNDMILIDGRCGAKNILEHKGITRYVIVSGNKFIFNNVEYTTIYVIEENAGKTKLYTAMSNTDTLALVCSESDQPLQPIGGNANFIYNPSDFKLTRYAKTTQDSVYIRQDLTLDITSKLSVSIKDSQIIVTPKTAQPSP